MREPWQASFGKSRIFPVHGSRLDTRTISETQNYWTSKVAEHTSSSVQILLMFRIVNLGPGFSIRRRRQEKWCNPYAMTAVCGEKVVT